eukprot:COSAG02_NODE_1977_length_10205_cov_5.317633_9_plen_30_part_00
MIPQSYVDLELTSLLTLEFVEVAIGTLGH